MAYESLLNTTALLSAVTYSSSLATGYSATVFFNLSGTTLGNQISDLTAVIAFQTVPSADGISLSATTGSSAFLYTLSSASIVTQQYTGYIASSTYKPSVSATVTFGWNSPNLGTTSINLSTNGTTTVLDPTKTNTMDNWFYYTTNPAAGANRAVRTTLGPARLVASMG